MKRACLFIPILIIFSHLAGKSQTINHWETAVFNTHCWISNCPPLNRPDGEVHFVYYDPEPDELTTAPKTYIKDFVDSFESILYSSEFSDRSKGYRAYINVNSFVGYFKIGELSRNVDAYKKSRFYFKNKDSKGGLICSGPPWDFYWAWKDITENCIHLFNWNVYFRNIF